MGSAAIDGDEEWSSRVDGKVVEQLEVKLNRHRVFTPKRLSMQVFLH